MLVVIKKNELLYYKGLLDLRINIPFQNKVFKKGEKELLLTEEEVNEILKRNGNLKLWNGEKYIKLNLGQFYDVLKNKKYKIEDYIEPKKVEPVKEVIKEEPKKEIQKQQPVIEEKKIEQPKVVEVEKEEKKVEQQPNNKKQEQNENKKQRHNNNNKQQNQGGDK